MRCRRPLLFTVAMGLMLAALPAVAHAQTMDKTAKPAMGAMKDTSAMTHDAAMGKGSMDKGAMDKGSMDKGSMEKGSMEKDAMHEQGTKDEKTSSKGKKNGKSKGEMDQAGAMSDKKGMAEPGKMSHP